MDLFLISLPAMDNVWTISSSFKVGQAPDEGNDRIWMIWYTKVWPSSVVELLHFTSIIATTHSVSPYGVVGQLLYLNEGHCQIAQTETTNFWPVLMTLSLWCACVCVCGGGGGGGRERKREK